MVTQLRRLWRRALERPPVPPLASERRAGQRLRLALLKLEDRTVLTTFTIPLDPISDEFATQIGMDTRLANMNGGTLENADAGASPMTSIGESNIDNPLNDTSSNANFIVDTVSLTAGNVSLNNQRFLIDTDSTLSVISPDVALALNIEMDNPVDTIEVQGIGGPMVVNGFIIDSLSVGLTNGDTLTFVNVPVFVLDAAPGLVDGVIGMNLLDGIDQALIDSFSVVDGQTVPTISSTGDPSSDPIVSARRDFIEFSNMPVFGEQVMQTLAEVIGSAARGFQVPDVESIGSPMAIAAQPATTVVRDAAPGSRLAAVFFEIPAVQAASSATPVTSASTFASAADQDFQPAPAAPTLRRAAAGGTIELEEPAEPAVPPVEPPMKVAPPAEMVLPAVIPIVSMEADQPDDEETALPANSPTSDDRIVVEVDETPAAGVEALVVPVDGTAGNVDYLMAAVGLVAGAYWLPESRGRKARRRLAEHNGA